MSFFIDHEVEYRDVEQAYLLALMEGPATYIVFPKALCTFEMHRMRSPLVLLEKALYGHPLVGRFGKGIVQRSVLTPFLHLLVSIDIAHLGIVIRVLYCVSIWMT